MLEIKQYANVFLIMNRMWQDLRTVFRALSFDPSVRAVILSAAGEKAFSVGLDVQWAANDPNGFVPPASDTRDGARRATGIRRLALDFQDCISAIEQCEKRKCASRKDCAEC